MRKQKLFWLLFVLLAFLAACKSTQNSNEQPIIEKDEAYNIHDLLGFALDRRQGINRPPHEELMSLASVRVPAPLPDILNEQRQPTSASLDDTLEDIALFFAAMRYGYAGYVYFGGDDVFLPIKEAVITEITTIDGNISAVELRGILMNHLSPVIKDAHFFVGGQSMMPNIENFISNTLRYIRSAQGFVNIETGYVLLEIEGFDVNDIMRLHVDKDGNIFYSPVLTLIDSEARYMQPTFVYQSEKRVQHSLSSAVIAPRRGGVTLPSLNYIDDIPIVTVNALGFDGHANSWNYTHVRPFLDFAQQLQDEPIVIIDLRSNIGGNGTLPARWIYALTGQIVHNNFVTLVAHENALEMATDDNPFLNATGTWEPFHNSAPIGTGYTLMDDFPDTLVQNETLLIFLVSRQTISAGEIFVDLAMNMTNTLVLGTSTAGVLAFSGDYTARSLPNTGLSFGFGRAMLLWPEGHFAEGRGIEPDIWVQGDALVAALALLQTN